MPDLHVSDDEILYRRVPDRKGNYVRDGGRCRVSSAAFGDRQRQTSVDRAKLRDHNPRNTQSSPSDFVVSLLTHRVRNEAGLDESKEAITRDVGDSKSGVCKVDVTPDPLDENPSHALIRGIPDFREDEKKVYKKVKKALARLADWAVGPPDPC